MIFCLKLFSRFVCFFFVFSLFFVFSYGADSQSYLQELFCGDNICSPGENNLNCLQDCSVNSVSYKINYDDSSNFVRIYNNIVTPLLIELRNLDETENSVTLSYDSILALFTNESELESSLTLAPNESRIISVPLRLQSDLENQYNSEFFTQIILRTSHGEVIDFPLKIRAYQNYDISKIALEILDDTVPYMDEVVLVMDFEEFNKYYSYNEILLNLTLVGENISLYLGNASFVHNGDKSVAFIYFTNFEALQGRSFGEGVYTLELSFEINKLTFGRELTFYFKPRFWTEDKILLAIVVSSILFFGSSFFMLILSIIITSSKGRAM